MLLPGRRYTGYSKRPAGERRNNNGDEINPCNHFPGFPALTLAMGVAVVALSCLGALEVQTAIALLGIGLASAGIVLLGKQ